MDKMLKEIHKELLDMKKDIEDIKRILQDDKLSDHAKQALREARMTPKSDYVELK